MYYALIYTNEGANNNIPFASAVAVSNDFEKLVAEMQECVNESIEVTDEDDECYWDKNFVVEHGNDYEVLLRHKTDSDLYVKYHIQPVNLI